MDVVNLPWKKGGEVHGCISDSMEKYMKNIQVTISSTLPCAGIEDVRQRTHCM